MAQHYRRKLSQNLDRMRKERVIKDMGTRQPVKAINNLGNTEENAQRRSIALTKVLTIMGPK